MHRISKHLEYNKLRSMASGVSIPLMNPDCNIYQPTTLLKMAKYEQSKNSNVFIGKLWEVKCTLDFSWPTVGVQYIKLQMK